MMRSFFIVTGTNIEKKGRDFMEWTPTSLEKFNFLSNLQLSPSGKKLIYTLTTANLKKNRYDHRIYLYDTEHHQSIPLTAGPTDNGAQWENESSILFSSGRNEDKESFSQEYYRISPYGGEAELAFTLPFSDAEVHPLGNGTFILLTSAQKKETLEKQKEDDPHAKDWSAFEELPYWFNGRGYVDQKVPQLYLYDETSKGLTPITGKDIGVQEFQLNEDKTKALFVCRTIEKTMPLHNKYAVLDLQTMEYELFEPFEKGRIQTAFFWGDDIIISAHQSNRQGLNELGDLYRVDGNDASRLFDADYELDYGSTVGSDLRYGGGRFMKVDGEFLYAIVTKEHNGVLIRYDKEGNMEVLTHQDGSVDDFDVLNETFYTLGLHNMRGQELYGQEGKALTSHNPTKETFPIETFTFTTREKEKTGFFIAPHKEEGKKYPALLLIHGGPKTVYGDALIHEMQVLAQVGFYVFFTNPHGSDGYGREFMDIRGKYGTIDYDDLMAATDAFLEKCPDANEEKLGVMGGSYGGFMTNWIIGHTDRFKAACSQRSISNWVSFFGNSDIGYYFATDQIAADPWSNPDLLWEKSPVRYANQVKTPTLFLHSDEDYRCWLPEGLQMYTALRYFDVPTRMVVFHGENHELSRSGKPQSRIKRLEEIVSWFTKYLKEE